MKDNKEEIIARFRQIKDFGFVKSRRKNNTGIGKTFEDYIGVVENNIDGPDLFGFEIKAHREETESYVTLFTKSPQFPRGANKYLRDTYGIPDEDFPIVKKLHTSMFASRFNTFANSYSFKLINDRDAQKIRIGIYNIDTKELIDDSVGYYYKSLESVLHKKLNNLFYVGADRQYRGKDEYFHFVKADIYTNPSLSNFINLVDEGKIMFDIRIGSYKSGPKFGKTHDHGSGFRILKTDIKLLYETHEIFE